MHTGIKILAFAPLVMNNLLYRKLPGDWDEVSLALQHVRKASTKLDRERVLPKGLLMNG